jgi:hypothetical protein
MAQTMTTAQQLHPSNTQLQEATKKALETQIPEGDVQAFLDKVGGPAAPAPIGATVDLKLAVWGKIDCEPDGQPWKYDNTVWGGPFYIGAAVGFMYTAYDSWDPFWQNVTSCHVQGIDVGGGILQVNWFISNGTPVGQFNGAAAGAGLVEGGGSGGWTRK